MFALLRKPFAHEVALLSREQWQSHPRLQGCVCWWPMLRTGMFNTGGNTYPAVTDFSKMGIDGYTLDMTLGDWGYGRTGWAGFKGPANVDRIYSTRTVPHNIGTGDFTFALTITSDSLGSTGSGLAGNGAFNPGIYTHSSGGNWGVYMSGYLTSTVALVDGQRYSLVVVRRAGTVYMYTDGVGSGSGSKTESIANNTLVVGRAGTSGNFGFGYTVYDFRVYDRAWTDAEIRSYHRYPWLEFATISDYIGSVSVAGGIAPTSTIYGPLVGCLGGPI